MNSLSLYQTAAFISAGMHADIPRLDDAREKLGTGAFEFVATAVEYTEFIAELYQAGYLLIGNMPGVFDYEVTEFFGQWYVDYAMEHGEIPKVSVACNRAIDLALDFFMKDTEIQTVPDSRGTIKNIFGRISRPVQPEL